MPTEQGSDAAAPIASSSESSIWRVVQRLMFASPSPQAPNELYAKAEWGAVRCERRRAIIEPDARMTTNTYFGRLPVSYLQRWTPIRKIEVVFRVRGAGRLEVHASDGEGEPRIQATVEVNAQTEQEVRLEAVVDRFMDGGFVWVEAVTAAEELVIEDCRWVAQEPRRQRLTSVVICTYNRADDCLNTMRALGEDTEVLETLDEVYVVDQGTDTVASREDFDKVVNLYGGKFRYLRQANLGGAGGFTRGMFEVTGQHKNNNVLFMDDDVLLEPETVLRMTAFANQATDPTIVGGQMLYLYHPNRLHIDAETTDLATLRPGVPVAGALHNIDLTEKLPHRRVTAGYNAWWSCLIPAEVTERIGLPLPMFFQWDDIEYGTRAGRHGFATVTLPGAAVWHADFAWKDWDDWARYFSLRNSLITAALHSDFDPRNISKVLGKQLATYLVSMQYGMAATLLKAVTDFLTGPDVLRDGGIEASAATRALRNEYPDTHRIQPADLGINDASTMPIVADPGDPSMPAAVFAKRVLYQMTGRTAGSAAILAKDAKWWTVSRFSSAMVTDSAQDSFRVRRYDRQVLTRLSADGARLMLRLAREGRVVREQWRTALPDLTSRENWQRLFNS
ncbi:MAG TPA: glycosyltransferase [Pseudonocardiaceae bacterium]|jgi:galactofuranosylgalactofuranosylrhamnosyl-N-acetylglucosaminyl-diphospho-decaprenol beta-1,5/1,6-galactofuranosyltransferase|nr:glycosyltransferase [Pseudonocardiaceae bacterium]